VTSWRPFLAVAAVLPLLTGVAGCSSPDGARAQALLAQAQLAQKGVSSETFSAKLSIQVKGQEMALKLDGGAYIKGPHAGDMLMNMRLSAPVALPFSSIQIAKVGSSAWMSMDGKKLSVPAGSLSSSSSADASPLAGFDFTRYVKAVSVQTGIVLDGKSVTKIVGVIDTASLLGGLTKLGGMTSATGLPSLDGKISDTRVVVFVDDATHLMIAALADLSMHSPSGDAKLHLDLAITGVNQPVALPAA
jgi:hypothetical protein